MQREEGLSKVPSTIWVKSPLCRPCAETVFRDWKGWPGKDKLPAVPQVGPYGCRVCSGFETLAPESVVFENVHRGWSTGLPDYFILRPYSLEDPAYGFLLKFGRPYRVLKPSPSRKSSPGAE